MSKTLSHCTSCGDNCEEESDEENFIMCHEMESGTNKRCCDTQVCTDCMEILTTHGDRSMKPIEIKRIKENTKSIWISVPPLCVWLYGHSLKFIKEDREQDLEYKESKKKELNSKTLDDEVEREIVETKTKQKKKSSIEIFTPSATSKSKQNSKSEFSSQYLIWSDVLECPKIGESCPKKKGEKQIKTKEDIPVSIIDKPIIKEKKRKVTIRDIIPPYDNPKSKKSRVFEDKKGVSSTVDKEELGSKKEIDVSKYPILFTAVGNRGQRLYHVYYPDTTKPLCKKFFIDNLVIINQHSNEEGANPKAEALYKLLNLCLTTKVKNTDFTEEISTISKIIGFKISSFDDIGRWDWKPNINSGPFARVIEFV